VVKAARRQLVAAVRTIGSVEIRGEQVLSMYARRKVVQAI